jgi:hypothetical protein
MARRHQTAPEADASNAPDGQAASGSGSQAPQAADTTVSGTTAGMPMARAPLHQAKLEIPLLDDSGDSYTRWSKTTTLVLKYRGLWDVVNGTSPAPNPATDAQAHLDWSRRDQEAHLQLILALSPAPHDHVLDATTSKDIWDLLKARYQGSGELRSHYLLERLFMTPFVDSEPMEPQIANVISITRQLNAINFTVSDQWLTGMLKVKLPPSWNTLKTVLAHAEEGKQTSKGVIAQILAEEHRCIREDGGDAKAYYAKSLGKGKNRQGNKKCSHCDRKGHNVSECRILKQEQEEEASKPDSRSGTPSSGKASRKSSSSKSSSSRASASAKVANADTSDDSDSGSDKNAKVYMARTVSAPPNPVTERAVERVYMTKAELRRSNLQHGWLIDSGASRTMCSHRSWFTSFTPLSNHTKVVLGDDSSIPATGTGRIRVRMYAEGKWIKSVLQDVLYVPDLQGNLLSVSRLTSRGAEVRFVDKSCQVYDRQKSLILEGNLQNDLYVMRMQANRVAKLATLDTQPGDVIQPPARALTTRLTSLTSSLDPSNGHRQPSAITHMVDEELVTSIGTPNGQPRASPYEPRLEGKQDREAMPLPTLPHKRHKYLALINDNSRWAPASPLRTLLNKARAMLSDAGLPKCWPTAGLNPCTLLGFSRNVVFDGGGATPRHERIIIILKNDDTRNDPRHERIILKNDDTRNDPRHERIILKNDDTRNDDTPPSTHLPVSDENPRYDVSPYSHRDTALADTLDWARDVNDHKMTGYVTSAALYGTEAEHTSGARTATEAAWLRQLPPELDQDTSSPNVLRVSQQVLGHARRLG